MLVSIRHLLLLAFALVLAGRIAAAPPLSSAPDGTLTLNLESETPAVLWLALDAEPGMGSSVVCPSVLGLDKARAAGRLFLPFQADLLVKTEQGRVVAVWHFQDFLWQPLDAAVWPTLTREGGRLTLKLTNGSPAAVQWFGREGNLWAPGKLSAARMDGQTYLPHFHQWRDGAWQLAGRFGPAGHRPVIYQMLPRLFGNANETRKWNGTLEENGSGKFSDLSDRILAGLHQDGFTDLWLTGVLQQATSTDYSAIGQPADDPDLLKGIAGSPYAIRDYFDVSPDYADDPARRLEEFRELVTRARAQGLRIMIDFVPNHVARSYASDTRHDLNFGLHDRRGMFFHPENNFFYLTPEVVPASQKAPLRLPTVNRRTGEILSPTAAVVGGADGLYPPENVHGRVTGNNVVSWEPSLGDWYETVKLNYGFNFLKPDQPPSHPSAITPGAPIPSTWKIMDEVIAYWQEMGVSGFRSDMSHMVPPEFWKWLIQRARERDPDVLFVAEAYEDDPAKVASWEPTLRDRAGVMVALLDAGFNAVYDDAGYDTLEYIYIRNAWANDFEREENALGPFFFDCALRYAENHDEVRLAHPETWGGLGMEVGRPVTGALFGLSRGPVMIYHGQMVGEPALGEEGFGGDDARTTIFDYWSMPEFNRWWNDGAADGGRLSEEQRELRSWYVNLLHQVKSPAFANGNYYPLNLVNEPNPFYGKIEDLGPAGHWFLSYLRHDPESGETFLVTVNFHPTVTLHHVRIRVPESVRLAVGLEDAAGPWLELRNTLGGVEPGLLALDLTSARLDGVVIPQMPPLSVAYWKMELSSEVSDGAYAVSPFPMGQAFLGAVPVQRVQAGDALRLDLRRFGHAGSTHRPEVAAPEGLETSVDELNFALTLRAPEQAGGLYPVTLRLVPRNGSGTDEVFETVVPVAVEPRQEQVFNHMAAGQVGHISLVGDFNHWNTQSHPMTRTGLDRYEARLRLPPGSYRYKVYRDGRYLTDETNPVREPDGHGGFNSILRVEAPAAEAPVLWFSRQEGNHLIFESNQALAAGALMADALPQDAGSRLLPVRVTGGQVMVDASGVSQGTQVRVIPVDDARRVGRPALGYVNGHRSDIWQSDIIYYAFTDRFFDGDPDLTRPVEDERVLDPANYHGGDFPGITQKLRAGYFDEIGVNVIWLAPINRNPDGAWQEYLPPYRFYTGYHGYWPVDSREVEPRFGGEQALRELVAESHARGYKILADLVLKHVHAENPFWQERPDLFGRLELPNGERNLREWNDYPFTTWFEPFLPGFDFSNPESVSLLVGESLFWLEDYQLDGYRLDAVKHIYPDFWWRFRSAIRDEFPGQNFYFVGETFQDRQGIADFVGPAMLDGQFDFPLYDVMIDSLAKHSAGLDRLEEALIASELVYGKITPMSPLLGNHDKSRFMAYADGDIPDPDEPDPEELGWIKTIAVDDPASYGKLKMAMTFLLTIDGVPMIYYGDEIGMTGAGDPDNRRMMRFGDEVTEDEEAVRQHFAKLAHARRAHPSLYLGSRRALLVEPERYAYLRAHGEDRALVVFNRSDREGEFNLSLNPELHDGLLLDVISGERLRVTSGKARFRLPPQSSALFVIPSES